MELLILIAVAIIAYFTLDLHKQVKELSKYKTAFDPDYPVYSSEDIWLSSIKIAQARSKYDEYLQKQQDYFQNHKQEIGKIKKNTDLPEEFKEYMRSYFQYAEELDNEVYQFRHMIDTNYEVRNSKRKYSQAIDELYDLPKRLNWVFRKKKYDYDEWLKRENE
jgi:hypothetical protein